CYQPCNPMVANACGAMNDVCLSLANFTYGICHTPVRECDPLMNMCPMGQNCAFSNTDLKCENEGPVAIGGDCSSERGARGGECVYLTGTNGPICYQPCDPNMPMRAPCPMGTTCHMIGEPFGICVP